ncbi:MAG: hypothetical protein JNL52_12070 [Flavobacteriales bacterium]|nr:hypothetical protein [Flavobacteriales bacterium]
MKHRTLLIVLAANLSIVGLQAQNVRLNFFGGYTFQDRFPIGGSYLGYTYNEARIAEGQHYGGSIEFDVRPNKAVELLYQTQSTQGYLQGSGFNEFGPYDISLHYIMIGGLGRLPFSDAVSGYGGLNMGCGWMTGDHNATKFAWGGKLGLQINLSSTVGIKAGAQLLSPVQGFGGGFYFGTGGASAGVSTYSTIYQFAFTGGLCFTFDRSGGPSAQRAPSSSAPSTGTVPPPPPPPAPRR